MSDAPIRFERGDGDVFYDDAGRRYIDLFTAHGTVWLGHGHPAVLQALHDQADRGWVSGGLGSAALDCARSRLDGWFDDGHRMVALYSTGMEAAEFALRLVRRATGRRRVVGLAGSMHGKSIATAALGWDNAKAAAPDWVARVPFVGSVAEQAMLEQLERALRPRDVAAVFLEPLQASCGGQRASPEAYRELEAICRRHGTLLVFDELLTGLYRTGPRFFHADLGFVPDVVLVGKGLGNGFPVAAVVAAASLEVEPSMFPGSTFAANPLAAAAMGATLKALGALGTRALVDGIDATVGAELADLPGCILRGRGALWVLQLPEGWAAHQLAVDAYRKGVAVGATGRQLRILPPVTIAAARLEAAVTTLRAVVLERAHAAERPGGGSVR